jgi:Fe-S-cluster-containing dehydrogenase component/DMSO reductase anchor subunit
MANSVARLPLLDTKPRAPRRLPLIDQYLREQKELTAVERFARVHDEAAGPAQERYYKDLLPASPPAEGQQYAFAVDLDICTGCKACVSACHNLNGLDEDETWRAVGLLHGGTTKAPVQQAVTTACHHCLDPACMNGCPVGAYEKDAMTGIVKHLDDQCIGCQYCVFTCPYEVPQFNAKKGIVRKCDMCSDRLSAGEAPACVQACPNEAIAITIVDKRQVVEDAQGDAFLPGAPSPGITMPTTIYKTERALPRNLLPASFFNVTPSHHHTPLVVMLVLTQLSVGAFWAELLACRVLPEPVALALRPFHASIAMVVGLVALGASVLHLGRPLYAFRAFIGLRTSWMSREILAFGAFAPLAMLYAASLWYPRAAPFLGLPAIAPPALHGVHEALGALVAAFGLLGVLCSVLIYHATRKRWWNASISGFKFFMTAGVLGLSTTIVIFAAEALASGDPGLTAPVDQVSQAMARLLVAATAVKLVSELSFFRHLGDKQQTDFKRTALLLKGDLVRYSVGRFVTGALGGIVVPLVLLTSAPTNVSAVVASAIGLVLLLGGELLERTLFFAAVSSPGMPEGFR